MEPLGDHADAAAKHPRFVPLVFRGTTWTFEHLEPFVFTLDPKLGFDITVVVLFSCHCFTESMGAADLVPAVEVFDDGGIARRLDPERYDLSRRFLPAVVATLHVRTIRVAGEGRQNFMTFEVLDPVQGLPVGHYAVFFEVTKDASRKKRLLLRVQSAYRIEALNDRQRRAGKVTLATLLRATYEGRRIRG
jgi:hypothetical protein